MEIISSSSSHNQQGDRIFELGVAHVKIYKTNNEKKKNKCDDVNNIPNIFGLQTQATDHKKEPIIDPTIEDEGKLPPYVIVVHGPPKVGKSLLIKCLVDYYNSNGGHGNDVIVLANRRRIQFVECPNNVNGMIDAAKYADAVIFLIDTRYGFEMETFEFLNILQVHGIVKVIGVLTYLDGIKNEEILTKTKQRLVAHFHSEIYEAAKVFCLPFLDNEMYSSEEISKLSSFISVMHFHRLSWRATQPYIVAKYFEDITPQDRVEEDEKCSRNIVLEGYLRGCNIKKASKAHIAGVGDFALYGIACLNDPFPLTDTRKRRRFRDKEGLGIEGLGIGTYLRLEVRGVPPEMVKNPCSPILVGVIGIEEEKAGYIKAILKRHSWHTKLLNTKDPITVSIGWRRYQAKPIYAMENCRGQLQMLDFTPKDKQCVAMFWGPLAPPSTGVVAVKSMADHEAAFRILATGVVLDNNQAVKVFKKRTLIRTSCKIFKKTARTKSGLRRKIKKAADKKVVDGLKTKNHQLREVIAKCKFKRTIRNSDSTFPCVWKQVQIPRDFNPLMIAPEPRDRIWQHIGPADELSELPESVNKLLEDMRDKEAPELDEVRKEEILSKLKEEYDDIRHSYYGAGWRQTLEQQRAVIIVEGESSAQNSPYELDDGAPSEDFMSLVRKPRAR
ncbi:hypothetical protein MKW92_052205 [Papaver armeniacum]|nr:hypothetical protein MKW92_052205 [Papaver armeniacum]